MLGTVGIDADEFAKALDLDGYIVIPGVVSSDRLAAFTDELLEAFDRQVEAGSAVQGRRARERAPQLLSW